MQHASRHLPAVKRLKIMLMALVGLTVMGTLGFHFIEGWSLFESLWMVTLMLSTIGISDTNVLSPGGRVFTMVMIVCGVGLVFTGIANLAQVLMEFDLPQLFGRQRMDKEIKQLSGHYIVCGAGRVGRSVVRSLQAERVPFVIVDRDAEAFGENPDEYLHLIGDAAKEKILLEAGIERAKGLVAATTTDAANIYIVLTARSINRGLRIIARASEEDAEKHLKTAGADNVISPYGSAGHRIASSFLRPNVVDFLDIAVSRDLDEKILMEEIVVGIDSRLAGTTVGSSGIHKQFGIMILSIKRKDGKSFFNPTAEATIDAGDCLIVMGEANRMPELEALALSKGRA